MIEINPDGTKDGLDIGHWHLQSKVKGVLSEHKRLQDRLGDLKRELKELRSQCKHPKTTRDVDGVVTCDVCKAIIPGDTNV